MNWIALKRRMRGWQIGRVAVAAGKEFWLPALAAAALLLGGVSTEKLRNFQGYFFGFLMLAWFSGQLVRIRRDLERRDSTKATIERLEGLSKALAEQLEAITGHASGGDSYTRFWPVVTHTLLDIPMFVEGKYPVRDLRLFVQDLNAVEPYKTMKHEYRDVMWPKIVEECFHIPLEGRDQIRCLLQAAAVNHTTTSEVIAQRVSEDFYLVAHRYRVNDGPWETTIPADWPGLNPANPNAIFRWEGPTLPNKNHA